MVTYRIHFIRHGSTEGNIAGKYIGRTDLRLSREGAAEIAFLKEHYEYPAADFVVTSPLQRCIQTADILYPDAETEQWEDFIECDFGALEGKSVEELRGDAAFAQWIADGMTGAPPGGEDPQSIVRRVSSGLDGLFRRMMAGNFSSAALVTHGGIMTLMLCAMGLPKRAASQYTAGAGRGYTVLMTPQLWMRDRAFETYGVVPYGLPESDIRSSADDLRKGIQRHG